MDTRKTEAEKKVLAENFLDAIDLSDAEMEAISGAYSRHRHHYYGYSSCTSINVVIIGGGSCFGGGFGRRGWW